MLIKIQTWLKFIHHCYCDCVFVCLPVELDYESSFWNQTLNMFVNFSVWSFIHLEIPIQYMYWI